MERGAIATFVGVLALLDASAARAQDPIPVGPQFQVNHHPPTTTARYPSVAKTPDGGFVVAWNGVDGSGQPAIEARRYGHTGEPLGPEFAVQSYSTTNMWFPAVAAEPGGGFVVVWVSVGSPGDDNSGGSIQARRFDAFGSPLGPQFQVNTHTTDHQDWQTVAAIPGGGFVVVWKSHGWSTGDPADWFLLGQRYDAAGSPAGAEFQISTDPPVTLSHPSVAAGDAGEFVVVWEGPGSGTDPHGIQGQRFDASGAPAGNQFQVNTSTLYQQVDPRVGKAADGRFVVAWAARDPTYDPIRAQRFDADGTAAGPEFEVSGFTYFTPRDPSIAVEPDGDFLVVWQPELPFELRGRRFDSQGQLLGTEFRVDQHSPDIFSALVDTAVEPDGDFVVVFNGGGPGSYYGIQGRRFSMTWIFLDGFEGGSTANWSSSVP